MADGETKGVGGRKRIDANVLQGSLARARHSLNAPLNMHPSQSRGYNRFWITRISDGLSRHALPRPKWSWKQE
eukprot:CAMPEP_0174382924 /NCGR_PEP_ID=MMETSP0811_2-20130205/124897_1 /TAXON_ID=73025 ORGANISM="Eutreptiella gymnastica-like, Strain CCMP1594" /NCGR_SAMPLE_ID=MMETSP0811_2 /ASSEMBLY_ACC=CAM_ASM_000667 /LENGTH=72 /DNA_ID=CAMNT_0015536345 /DNA_START=1447 /DNA_END=1665 /DNA_ORIENTATION=+